MARKVGGRASLLAGLAPGYVQGALIARSRPIADNGRMLLAVRCGNGYWVEMADNVNLS